MDPTQLPLQGEWGKEGLKLFKVLFGTEEPKHKNWEIIEMGVDQTTAVIQGACTSCE